MRKRIRTVVKSLLILGAGFGGLAAQSSAAGTYYVATNGVAPNDGAGWGTAFTQIQDALDVATPGDIIHLAGHTFELIAPLAWTNASDVTLLGGYEAVPGIEPGPQDADLWPTVITRDAGVDIRLLAIEDVDDIRIERVHFTGGRVVDTAPLEGGAIRAVNVNDLRFNECRFRDNRVARSAGDTDFGGGAIWAADVGSLHIEDCLFSDNEGFNSQENSSVRVRGGAIRVGAAVGLHIRDSRFTANRVASSHRCRGEGGAIYAPDGSGSISNTVFNGNAADMTGHWGTEPRGGALWLGGTWALGHVEVANSRLISGTNRDGLGGALYLASGTYRLHNMLIVNSDAGAGNPDGAGIYAESGADVEISNITLADNVGGVALHNVGASVVVRNSILYNNRPADVRPTSPPTLSHCLIGDGTGTGVNDNFVADPLFARPLYYLAPDSLAVNAGDRTVAEAGLVGMTTLSDGTPDSGTVNLGYHYAEGLVMDLELHVAESGDDGNDGETPAQALRSITRALELAAPRTRIHVGAGAYTDGVESFPLRIEGYSIQILGAGREVTVIDADGAGTRVFELYDTRGDTRLEGVTVMGGANTATAFGGGMHIENAAVALVDVAISDNIQDLSGAHNYGGGLYAIKASGIVDHSEITGNAGGLSGGWSRNMHGAGAWLRGAWQIRNTVVSENTANAGGTNRHPQGGGLFLHSGVFGLRNAQIDRNIVDIGGGASKGGAGIWTGTDAHVTLENVTIADNNLHGLRGNPVTVVHNSILWDNGEADFLNMTEDAFSFSNAGGLTPDVQDNLSDNPRFVDAENGDYRLSAADDSPCIGAGEIRPWMAGSVDLAGNPRILMGTVDMGAYETLPPVGTLIRVR